MEKFSKIIFFTLIPIFCMLSASNALANEQEDDDMDACKVISAINLAAVTYIAQGYVVAEALKWAGAITIGGAGASIDSYCEDVIERSLDHETYTDEQIQGYRDTFCGGDFYCNGAVYATMDDLCGPFHNCPVSPTSCVNNLAYCTDTMFSSRGMTVGQYIDGLNYISGGLFMNSWPHNIANPNPGSFAPQ